MSELSKGAIFTRVLLLALGWAYVIYLLAKRLPAGHKTIGIPHSLSDLKELILYV